MRWQLGTDGTIGRVTGKVSEQFAKLIVRVKSYGIRVLTLPLRKISADTQFKVSIHYSRMYLKFGAYHFGEVSRWDLQLS